MKNACACLVVAALLSFTGLCFAYGLEDIAEQRREFGVGKGGGAAKVEERLLRRFSSRATRDGSVLYVRTRHGTVALRDRFVEGGDLDNDDWVEHRYMGFLDGIGYHVVCLLHYESIDYLLISDTSKERTRMYALPNMSPLSTRIVSVSASIASWVPNDLSVWKVTPDHLVLEYNNREDELRTFLGWKGESTVLLDTFNFEGGSFCPGKPMKIHKVLAADGNSWRLSVASPPNIRCNAELDY